MTRFLLLSNSCGFVDVGRCRWREHESVVCSCCWPSPAHSFSVLRTVGLAIIFYCLRFETSLFVASYYLQDYGGGIRPRPHTGLTDSAPNLSVITSRHGPHWEHTSSIVAYIRFITKNMLPSNGRCLQNRRLATGLCATIFYSENSKERDQIEELCV
jgi:hypothetical protein